ncbi:MAG: hypothetical protein ACREOK_04505 [Gemmatimonadaceae bacterium]
MKQSVFVGVAALLVSTGCGMDNSPTLPVIPYGAGKVDAKASVQRIGMTGDIGPLTDASGGEVVASTASRPFRNLTLSDVRITLNSPTGDPAVCRQAGSTRTYDETSFGGNAGTWQGELVIWQGRTTTASNFRFNGSRTIGDGSVEVVQFTSNDNDAVQTTSDGTTTLTFNSAPLGFGGQSTHFDVDAAGLPILRCVRVVMTAAP